MRYNREIERKFTLPNTFYWYALKILETEFSNLVSILSGESTDTFWTAPNVDFVRLRKNTSELTIKKTDQETIIDRIEENLVVDYETALRWANLVFGTPTGVLEKTYDVFYLEDAIISLYRVTGHPQVFLEVEAEDIETVNKYSSSLQKTFNMKQEYRSLFQIILGDK